MGQINKEQAESIARKLGAKIVKGRKAHDVATVYYEGVLVCHFGIRRGSNKDAPHGHIPRDIYVSTRDARLLGQCPMSADEYFRILEKKGKLPSEK